MYLFKIFIPFYAFLKKKDNLKLVACVLITNSPELEIAKLLYKVHQFTKFLYSHNVCECNVMDNG